MMRGPVVRLSSRMAVGQGARVRHCSGLVTTTLESQGQVALITLNAPKKLNALTEAMGKELTARVQELREDKGVRVAILTGLHLLCTLSAVHTVLGLSVN